MNVPHPDNLDSVITEGGRYVCVGAADTGKTTFATHTARATGAVLLDADIGQSEIGPPGMMDIALPESEGRWLVRGQWYVGDITPFSSIPRVITGVRRLADRAVELGARSVVVDTSSYVPMPASHVLSNAIVETLWPCTVIAIQARDEMEPWLRGVSAPVVRLTARQAVREKPPALRATRRAARLAAYFEGSVRHTVELSRVPLRGTRLGFGKPLTPTDHRIAAGILGCPVVHMERSRTSLAVWTLGLPRRGEEAAAAEFGVNSTVAFDASFWDGRSVGFLGPGGICLAMGFIEKMDWPSLTATVLSPARSVTEAIAVCLGLMRHRRNGEARRPVPDRQA